MGDDLPISSEFIVGRYRVEREVGRGGMGRVLCAQDTRLNRRVALKMLPPHGTRARELSHRLAIEARATSALNHPGIASVYDFVEQGENSFIVYEYVEGRTLRQEMAQVGFTTDQVRDIGTQLADALVAAHAHGIMHRDLKPENIMLVADDDSPWRVKILDFGLAKHFNDPMSAAEENLSETVSIATSPGFLVGTVNYMSPEQLEERPVDARTDVYTLGLVLYEMATGVNPFVGKTRSSTIANILTQQAPPVQLNTPAAPCEVDSILQKCLRKRPEDRYQSARELLVDLRNFRRIPKEPAGVSPTPETEPSLFRRFFLLFGATPYRRWELAHVRLCLWSLFLCYLGWRFRQWNPGRSGLILFLVELVCIALLWVLVTLLLYLGAVDRKGLPRRVWKLAPWIRWSTIALALVTWAMAGILVPSHAGLAAFLAFCGASGAFAVLFYKPIIDRAAFPEPN